MNNKFSSKTPLLFFLFTISAFAQLEYYGFWDCKQFFKDELTGKVDIPNNSGVAMQWEYTEVVDNCLPGKKLLINSTDYFFFDTNSNGRPDLEEIDDSVLWNQKLDNFKNKNLRLNQQKYNDACLGIIIAEEPLAFVSKNHTIRDYQYAEPIFKDLNFTASGNFSNLDGNSPWDDILLVYFHTAEQFTEVKIMKSNGTGFSDPITCFSISDSNFEFEKIIFITSGDYNGDSFTDLAVFYEDNLDIQIQVFYSDGELLQSNYTTEFSFPKTEYHLENIKFISSGNYDSFSEDEIAVFYRTNEMSSIYVFSPLIKEYRIWYEEKNSGWDINMIRYVVSGNFDGRNDNKTSELAVLYDYPHSSKSRIEIFRGNAEHFPDKFWGYENWFEKDYSDIDFNFVRGFLKADINFDRNDDLILLYDTPPDNKIFGSYQRVLRYLSYPNEKVVKNRLQYAGMMRNDHFKAGTNFSFDHVEYALSGDFLINNFGGHPILNDSVWITNPDNNNRIDDLLFFWDYSKDHKRIECFISKPHLMFGNKEILAKLSKKIQSHLNKPTMILYTEMCTYIPDIFVTEVDWIGVDPYPFTKSTQLNDTRQRNRLHTALQNIIKNTVNDIFLVGQSASFKGDDPGSMRFPTEEELNYYLEVAQTYNRVKALYWWWYPDIPKADFYGASSEGGEHLLEQQKIIGEKIFSR